MAILQTIFEQLTRQNKTIAVAESCTGGLLAKKLTDLAGSSQFFKLGVISYSNDSKIKTLKVKPETLKKNGAVSQATALEMARGVRKILKTDFGISITGIAGPDGGTKPKPVGTVFIAVDTSNEQLCIEYQFNGTRAQIRNQSANQALKLLLEFLK